MKGLSEAVDPEIGINTCTDKNSDSGVMTEGDSEQSNINKPSRSTEVRHFLSKFAKSKAIDIKSCSNNPCCKVVTNSVFFYKLFPV